MNGLAPAERRLACSILHERFLRCTRAGLGDALISGDTDTVTRRCATLFADLTLSCSELLRSGELHAPRVAAPPRAS